MAIGAYRVAMPGCVEWVDCGYCLAMAMGFLRFVVGLCYGLMWRNVEECVHEKHLLSLLFVFVILKTIIFAVQNIVN